MRGTEARTEPGPLASTSVRRAMHRGVITCRADASLRSVAGTMAAHRIHAVAVEAGDEWRLVSDLDLVGAAEDGQLDGRTAGEIAASPSLSVAPDETLERAAQLMREYATSHLVVVHPHTGRPLGVLSTLDLANALAEGQVDG